MYLKYLVLGINGTLYSYNFIFPVIHIFNYYLFSLLLLYTCSLLIQIINLKIIIYFFLSNSYIKENNVFNRQFKEYLFLEITQLLNFLIKMFYKIEYIWHLI